MLTILASLLDALQVSASEQNAIGMVVIRGNSIVMIEALERLND